MNKSAIFAVIIACFGIPLPSGANDALTERTQNFLAKRWKFEKNQTKGAGAPGTPRVVVRPLACGATAVNVSNARNAGFVIYAGSDADAPVMGYSLTDTINADNLPPAAAEFLTQYKAAIAKAPASRAGSTYPTPSVEPVEPFITTKWGQEAPFNSQCPLYQGKRSVTGCDAVAVGQVLHYYKAKNFNDYTIEYADERSLEEVSVNFSRHDFNYDAMPDVYQPGQYTQEQVDAVAEMMYVAGAACLTQWSTYSSSGQWPLVALDKYFNLNANFYIREGLPTGFWMRKIQENMSARRPILYTGTGISNSAYSAHIFILDGIDADNFVHINWGWDGEADGYYDITFCLPDFLNKDDDGYYMKQMMICDITPRKAGETYREKYVATSTTKMEYTSTSHKDRIYGSVTGVTNNSYERLDKAARVIARNVDNPSAPTHTIGGCKYLPVFPSWKYADWKAYAQGYDPSSEIPEGTWELVMETYDEATGETVATAPIPMRPYFTVTNQEIVKKGYLDFPEGKTELAEDSIHLSFDALTPLTDVIAKTPFFAKVKTRSLLTLPGSSGRSSANLCFTNVETGKAYITQRGVTLYDFNYSGLNYEGIIEITPPTNPDNGFTMPAGEYIVTVSKSSYDPTPAERIVYPEPIRLTVRPAVDYPILRYNMDGTLMPESWNQGLDYTKKWYDNVRLRYNKGIETANNNYNPVEMMLFVREADNPNSEEIMLSSFKFDPTNFLNATDPYLPGYLYPFEGEHIFYLRYLTPDGIRDLLPKRWDFIDEATGLPAKPTAHFIQAAPHTRVPMIEVQNPTLTGRRLTLTAKNLAPSSFGGKIYVQIYDFEHGTVATAGSDSIGIESGEALPLEFPLAAEAGNTYEVYIRAVSAIPTIYDTYHPTLTTLPDGSIAHFTLKGGQLVGVEHVRDDRGELRVGVDNGAIVVEGIADNAAVSIYAPDGRRLRSTLSRRIEGLSPGCYIVTSGCLSAKVVVR